MYIETSYPRVTGDKATLISPDISSSIPICLSFKAHMYGKDIDRLRIDMIKGSSRTMLLETIGDQGNKWQSYDVDLPPGGPYKVNPDNYIPFKCIVVNPLQTHMDS